MEEVSINIEKKKEINPNDLELSICCQGHSPE